MIRIAEVFSPNQTGLARMVKLGYDGVCRPDHVPTMEGDSNDSPMYSSIGRLFAIGYIKGLREAVYST
jgi:mannonate dehydratase